MPATGARSGAVQATLNHVNIRLDVPILNQLVVLPRFITGTMR